MINFSSNTVFLADVIIEALKILFDEELIICPPLVGYCSLITC